jgi:hypothetical protein
VKLVCVLVMVLAGAVTARPLDRLGGGPHVESVRWVARQCARHPNRRLRARVLGWLDGVPTTFGATAARLFQNQDLTAFFWNDRVPFLQVGSVPKGQRYPWLKWTVATGTVFCGHSFDPSTLPNWAGVIDVTRWQRGRPPIRGSGA